MQRMGYGDRRDGGRSPMRRRRAGRGGGARRMRSRCRCGLGGLGGKFRVRETTVVKAVSEDPENAREGCCVQL